MILKRNIFAANEGGLTDPANKSLNESPAKDLYVIRRIRCRIENGYVQSGVGSSFLARYENRGSFVQNRLDGEYVRWAGLCDLRLEHEWAVEYPCPGTRRVAGGSLFSPHAAISFPKPKILSLAYHDLLFHKATYYIQISSEYGNRQARIRSPAFIFIVCNVPS